MSPLKPLLKPKLFSNSASPGQMYIYRIAAKNDALEYFGPHSAHVTAFAASLPGITRNLGYVASTRQAGKTGSVQEVYVK